MTTALLEAKPTTTRANYGWSADFRQRAALRRVAVLAVHHVQVGGLNYCGGAEKYACNVIDALLDAGAAVHVGYSGTDIYGELAAAHGGERLRVERTGWINDALSGDARLKLTTIFARRRWLRQTGADTVFAVQQASGGAFAASLIAARLLGLRVLGSIRQPPQSLPEATAKRRLGFLPSAQFWRRRLVWRKKLPALCCDALIFNSRRVAEDYFREYGFPRRRSRVIFNGEVVHSAAAPRRPMRPRHVACVGRITTAKGADLLLDAFVLVARRFSDARLTYYGDGPLTPSLQDRSRRLGLGGRVRFAGYEPQRERIYADVDVCVQPSLREAMSNCVVEALARGIPCVVSDVGGLPETVEDGRCGFVVPAGRPEAFGEALVRLLGDADLYADFSAAALSRAREHFDIARVMRQTVETILGI